MRFSLKPILIAAAILSVGATQAACGKNVKPGEVGIKSRSIALGGPAGVQPKPLPVGWHGTGFGEEIILMPTISRVYPFTRAPDERGPENEEITFNDNNAQPMTADVQVQLAINPALAPKLYQTWKLDFDALIDGPIRNDIMTEIGKQTEKVQVDYLYRGGRQEVLRLALVELQRKWGPQGVTISRLEWIGSIRYPPSLLASIAAKTKAETDRVAALAQKETAIAQGATVIEQARAQAEANRLITASLSPELNESRAIAKWNGVMPTTVAGGALPFVNVK